jgi:hypothetical protein
VNGRERPAGAEHNLLSVRIYRKGDGRFSELKVRDAGALSDQASPQQLPRERFSPPSGGWLHCAANDK